MNNRKLSTALKLLLVGALVLALTGCSLVVKDPAVDAKQTIISVNGQTMDKQGFAALYNAALNQEYYMQQMYQQFGMVKEIKVDHAKVMQTAIEAQVKKMVNQQKAAEWGLDKLGDEDQATLKANTDKAWQDLMDQIQKQDFANTELTGEALTKALEEKATTYGLNRESVEKDETEKIVMQKLQAKAAEGVTVSDEAVKADYDQKVAEAKTQYEADKSAFGQAVNAGQTVYLRPEGYRYVKQVLVKFTDEDAEALKPLQTAVTDATKARDEAKQLFDTNAEGLAQADLDADTKKGFEEKVEPLTQDLKAAEEKLSEATKALDEKKAAAYAAIQPKAFEIYGRAMAGENFDTLVKDFNQDTGMPAQGYAVTEGFASFDEAFVKPAMALKEVGQVAQPSAGMYGYYIVQYAADITPGPVDLAEVKDGIHETLLTQAKQEAYEAASAKWLSEAKVETFADRMD